MGFVFARLFKVLAASRAIMIPASTCLSLIGCDASKINKEFAFKVCSFTSACRSEIDRRMADECSIMYYYYLEALTNNSTESRITRARVNCWYQAEDCEQLLACTRGTFEQAEHCQSNPTEHSACVGGMAVDCFDGEVTYATDCSSAGLGCYESGASGECGVGACDPAATEPYCRRERLVACSSGGALIEIDCGGAGEMRCGLKDDGELGCVGVGDACDQTFWPRCDGRYIVWCAGARVARIDCEDMLVGSRCSTDDDFYFCVPEDNCPLSLYETETCQGGVITFCFMREVAKLDCRKYGLSGCGTEVVDNHTVAFCVP